MPLIAVTSAKGGTGASTVALALAGTWRPHQRRPVLVEADPGGGDLLVHFQLPDGPGLVSLASVAHHAGLDARLVAGHARELHGGVRVVPAPVSAERTAPVLELLAPLWAQADLDGEVVVADVGRHLGLSGGRELLERADVVLLVSGGSAAALAHARDAARSLDGRVKALMVVVSGAVAHSREEIAAALEAQVAVLPWDEASAVMLRGEPQLKRSRQDRHAYALLQQIPPLGTCLLAHLPEPAAVPTVPSAVEPPRGRVALADALRHGD